MSEETRSVKAIESLSVPNHVNPTRYRLRLTAICGFVGLFAIFWMKSCDPIFRPFNRARFDTTMWFRHSEDNTVKIGMANDIVTRVIKPGMTRRQAEEILGKGGWYSYGAENYRPELGDAAGELSYALGEPPMMMMKCAYVVIVVNRADVILKAEIVVRNS